MTEAMEDCGCSEEYGPCETHGEVLAQREGASLRTADELAICFLQDAQSIDADILSPYGKDVMDRVAQNFIEHGSGWVTDDPDLGEELSSLLHQVENNLGPDAQTYWEDGYRIVKITGGPLKEI